MSDPWTSIGTVIGGGGALALIAAIAVFVTRGAIATAVAQAGAEEIERLKGQLAKELEKERQSFAREVQRESQEAARALEGFKADLALAAKRREIAEGIASFIDAYKRTPANALEEQRRALEAAYHRIVLWVPSELVSLITAMIATGVHPRPDPKDLVIAARKAILGTEAGPFVGDDLVHLADQA